MSNMYILDENNQPQQASGIVEWSKWFSSESLRCVGYDTVGDIYVSTVFLGVDHRFGLKGDPIL